MQAPTERHKGPTRDELNKFLEDITIAKATAGGEMASIEAPRVICEHYNLGNLKGFDAAGYFVMNDVRVYETGKMIEKQKEEAVPLHMKLHPNGY